METENLGSKREISFYGPIFIKSNCIELPVNITGDVISKNDTGTNVENNEHAFVETTHSKPPKQHRVALSPKRLLRRFGRGMALIRNDKGDLGNDKHDQIVDDNHEDRIEKRVHHERTKGKGTRKHIQNDDSTYISFRDNEADIEYSMQWHGVYPGNKQAGKSMDLIGKDRGQNDQDGSRFEVAEHFPAEKLGMQHSSLDSTHKDDGILNGNKSPKMQRKHLGKSKQRDNLTTEEKHTTTIMRSNDETDIINAASDVVKLNRGFGAKTCLLGISSLNTETKSDTCTSENRPNDVSKTVTYMYQSKDENGLENAKDKAFGKKRVLTEIMSNAYMMNGNHGVNDLEPVVNESYHQNLKRDLTTNRMKDLNDNTAVDTNKENVKTIDESSRNCCKDDEKRSSTSTSGSMLKDKQALNNLKGSAEKASRVGTQGETNTKHIAVGGAQNENSKPSKITAQEEKIHRFIDDMDDRHETPEFDDTVRSAYEELNMPKYGTVSGNIDLKKDDKQNKQKESNKTDRNGELPKIKRRNVNGRQLQKDSYATESRAALKEMTRTNLLHRRHASEGALDSKLENLFVEPRWRPLSTDFQDYVAVVAIDFGTAYSGYAYCFTNHPDMIYMMRKPEGGDPGIYNQKTPTSILLTPEGKFHSFGYAARDHFNDLDQKDAQNWMYFERFKMLLHSSENITADTKLMSDGGKEITALTVFSYGLSYFKDHALRELSDQSGLHITSDVIKWVITVPAIWSASAKQFMRQAAYNAGIVSPVNHSHLLIALEPEAASLYCLRQRLLHPVEFGVADDSCERFSPSASLESLFTPGSTAGIRYMIVDCGGGTTDITVHQIDSGGCLREIHKAVGGPFGSIGIDKEFEALLCAVFGKDTIHLFKTKRPAGWVDLMAGFESRKRGAGPYRRTYTTVSLPFSFMEFYKRRKGHSVETAVKKCGSKDITYTSSGMLRLSPPLMCRLFYPTINSIKQEIGNIMNHPDARGLSYLLLVGGLAESSMLQHEIRKEFGHILKIIIPQGVSTITAKGAVLYGLNPDVIIQRRSRLTYGVGVLHRFKPEKHPVEKRIVKDGIAWCSDILDHFVSVDQCIGIGETVVRSYTPVRQEQTATIINIYSTEKTDAEFITDPGVKHCGMLRLSLNADDDRELSEGALSAKRDVTDSALNAGARYTGRREIRASMMFGDTEIKVTAVDMTTGRTVKADIDFLNS